MNLLLLSPSDFISEKEILVEGRRAEHIHCVLRASEGDLIRTGLVNGGLGQARLLSQDRRSARLELLSLQDVPPCPRDLIFLIALPRPQSFKKTLHFIASAGIKKAVFIATERVEKSYWKSSAVQPDAIQEELLLGLEQGMDTVFPEILLRPDLRSFITSGELDFIASDSRKYIAHPLRDACECPYNIRERVCVAIGPEGGFVPSELGLFQNHGFKPVTIGSHILRVEFAVAFIAGRLS